MALMVQHNTSDALVAEYHFGRPQAYLDASGTRPRPHCALNLRDTRVDRAAENIACDSVDFAPPR